MYGAACENNPFTPHLPYSFQEMVVPAGTVVVLSITSIDVIHSWWVPSLGGKVDAVPGYTTYTWFKATRPGALFHGQCAQLCGRQHAFMTALVQVVSPSRIPGLAPAPVEVDFNCELAGHPAALVPDGQRKPLGDCECP